MPSNTSATDDLPPRTWRQWWRAWPKWFRIGVWGCVGMIVLHLALVVRMVIGLHEPVEIGELRKHDCQIRYVWDKQAQRTYGETPYLFYLLLNAGLSGTSCCNVEEIDLFFPSELDRPITTDHDLELIGNHFPNLKTLYVEQADITANGLRKLRGCRQLEKLSIAFSNLNDDDIQELVDLPQLAELRLVETQVTDAVIPILRQMPSLRSVDLSSTKVTLAAIEEWRASAGKSVPIIRTDRQ